MVAGELWLCCGLLCIQPAVMCIIKPKAAKAMTASRAADRVLEGVPSEAEGEKSTRECARDSTLP